MWDALQLQSFVVGAALILIYQAARFGDIYAEDPVTSRYVSLLPGAGVRDFAGPRAYHWALVAFLVSSLAVYSLLCMISPNVLIGAVKLLSNNPDAEKIAQGVPLPLYIAALFMGLTQPIIPGLAQFQVAQRNFFHDRIEVPRRIIDVSESLTVAIGARAGANKQQLVAEVRKLVGDDFLTSLETYGDLPFYKLQLEKLGVASGALEPTIADSSVKELRALIERLVLCALVAVSRKSGPKPLAKVAQTLGVPLADLKHNNNVGPRIARLVASSVLFVAGLLLIAELLLSLATPVDTMVGKSVTDGLWPSTLEYSFDELWSIALPIGVCMILAVVKLVPRDEVRASDPDAQGESSLFDDFLDFVQSNAAVLLLWIVATVAIKVGMMFWEYGTFNLPADARSPLRLMLPALQSFITVTVCLLTTWYLASSTRKEQNRGPSLLLAAMLIAGATGALALLYDFAFLDQYLTAHPESRPGSVHHVFSVTANILVSVCAFLSVAVFFKGRRIKQSVPKVVIRPEVPSLNTLVPPVQAPPLAPVDMVDPAPEHATSK
ncbi:MAG: hypothetical protein JO289_01560 [Xanthobacteraceae bacterium]|nr:hypothetical protein [Xanthobacteraceae bacterium]